MCRAMQRQCRKSNAVELLYFYSGPHAISNTGRVIREPLLAALAFVCMPGFWQATAIYLKPKRIAPHTKPFFCPHSCGVLQWCGTHYL